jgi:serine/threonine-protein kinase
MLSTGETLAGYRIEGVAGVGGMGVVYRATQMSLDRPVALKVLASTLVDNETFRERFRREGRHAAALDHPNIIPVYEAGESDGLLFIAMRLVDGPSLADLIAGELVTGSEALRVVAAIASALDAAHEAGLVHRDIKPQNILLTRGGHPYLADFGITKGSDNAALTHSGDFVGSLNYVAPEQIDGSDVTGASDIYSLTAVLFHCLSGLHPYERDSDAALMHAHLIAPPPTLLERGVTGGPPSLDEVFRTGMAKLPSERYGSATELADACRAALAGVGPATLDGAPAFPAGGVPRPAPAPAPPRSTTEPDQFAWASAPAPPPPPPPASMPPPLPDPPPIVSPPPPDPSPVSPFQDPAFPAPRDLTAADVRRTPPRADDAPADRSMQRAALLGLVASLTLVGAPLAGYTLGHDDAPPGPARAASAALTLEHDPSWRPAAVTIKGLALRQPVTLTRADGVRLAAGRLPRYAAGFDPVPAALRKRFKGKTADATIRLGARSAVRHAAAVGGRDRLWLALVPDTKGWVAVACEGPGADRPTACPAVAASLAIKGATAVPLGASAEVAAEISAAVGDLSTARRTAARPLRSASLITREHALNRVAAAHTRAAGRLAGLDLRPQEEPPVAAVATALRRQAPNLKRLATATKRRARGDYDAARRAIRRQERRVATALRQLKGIGYDAS